MPNVTIENTVNHLLEFGLRLDSGELRVIRLVPGDTVPNAAWPDSIPDEQITEYLRDLARSGSVKIDPIIQAITIEFQAATSAFDRDTGTQQIVITVTTDDGNDTGEDVSVEVNDDGTGTATEGDDYTYSPNPTILTIPAGTPSGSIFSVDVGLPSSTGSEETVDFSLSNPTGAAELGVQATHEMTINSNAVATLIEVTLPTTPIGPQGAQVNGATFAFADEIGGPAGEVLVRITNTAVSGNLTLSGIGVTGDVDFAGPPGAAFRLDSGIPGTPIVLGPGGTQDLLFYFFAGGSPAPVPAGIYSTNISITHDGSNETTPFELTLQGDSNFAPSS